MPADLLVLLGFARSETLAAMVGAALKAGQPSLHDQVDDYSRPFMRRLSADHFHFMDRINAALAREAARASS